MKFLSLNSKKMYLQVKPEKFIGFRYEKTKYQENNKNW